MKNNMEDVQLVVQRASQQIGTFTGMVLDRIVACTRREQGWILDCEVVERQAIPNAMDILGLYEFELDLKGNVEQFRRKSSRHRGDVITDL